MPNLLTILHPTTANRSCNAKCYNATGKRCTCICGGRNHGVGLKQAIKNSAQLFLFPVLLHDTTTARPKPRIIDADQSVHRRLHHIYCPKPPAP